MGPPLGQYKVVLFSRWSDFLSYVCIHIHGAVMFGSCEYTIIKLNRSIYTA